VGAFLIFLGVCGPIQTLAALEQQIVLGREEGWRDFPSVRNLVLRTGMWGTLDFFLQGQEYQPVPGQTDLLLHFDGKAAADQTGHYRLEPDRTLIATNVRQMGAASAGFTNDARGMKLDPGPEALFARGTRWGDFTIEFWLRPELTSDGEELLTWIGSRWQQGKIAPQELRCALRSRRLVWEFVDFFVAEEAGAPSTNAPPSVRPRASTQSSNTAYSGTASTPPSVIRLEGLSRLQPRTWRHHLLHFDSRSGLLEYLLDGVPEAVTYTLDSSAGGSPLIPYTGGADTAPVYLGRGYTGFMDELRISRAFVEAPVLTRFDGRSGVATSSPLDLGYTGTRLKRIEAVYRTESDSGIFFFYRLADRLTGEELSGDWVQFKPGESLTDARGRWVQLRVELFPDGRGEASPQLSELRVVYEQNLPPAAPAGVQAVAGNSQVRLRWNVVREENLRGYLVYYGPSPGNYHGTGADRGPSPVEVGAATEVTLGGLENGRLYYFAVVAYDDTEPPLRSAFSREVSARPSGAN
jgi:hypothetical protein